MRLIGSANKWIGTSLETKPYPGMLDVGTRVALTADDVPVGSTFYEENTGWEFTYRGGGTWELSPDSGRTALIIAKLEEVAAAIREGITETKRLNGHLTIGSDLEGEEALELAKG